MTRNCKTCGQMIDHERLEALPHTLTCTEHSKEQKNLALMFQDGKTAAYVEVIRTNGLGAKENVRQATRAFRRGR